MFNIPGVIVACLAVLIGIHAVVSFLSGPDSFQAILDFGFVPAVWTLHFDPGALEPILENALSGEAAERSARLAFAQFVLAQAPAGPWSFLTYALLHGSWTHVGLNGMWLAAFGTPIARRCGALRFLALGALTALAGALAHWASHAYDTTPMVGASAAVSGMMAAAARFMFTPLHPDDAALFSGHAHLRPRQSLADLASNRRVLIFLGIWFAINLLFGYAAVPLGLAEGGIAWEAHLGGFVAGFLLFPLMDPYREHPGLGERTSS